MTEIKFPETTSKERNFLNSRERACKSENLEFDWNKELDEFRKGVLPVKPDKFHFDNYGREMKVEKQSMRKYRNGKFKGFAFSRKKNTKGAFGQSDPCYHKNPKVIEKKKATKNKLWNSIVETLSNTFKSED